MKVRVYSLLNVFIGFALVATGAGAKTSDCEYSGRGEMYSMADGTHSKERSFSLKADRFPLGNGRFLIRETKVWSSGITETKEFYAPGSSGYFKSEIPFPGGRLASAGVCPSHDQCFGELHVFVGAGSSEKAVYGGQFSSRYDQRSIRTVTFDRINGYFVNEDLESVTDCPWD